MRKKYTLFVTLLFALICFVPASEAAGRNRFTQEELAYMPAVQQIKLFKSGTITPTDVLEAQIARVKKYNGPINSKREELKDYLTFNGKVNALCFERFDEARVAAKEAEKRYKNGTARPIEGVTVGVKNENAVVGWRVDWGTLLLKDAPLCTEDCAIIDNLKNAGAILVFSTTIPEFYIHSMTWSKLYGVTRNPWNLYYGVGASSGGSCAALAAGFCTLATGSDMGGSIRIPSSMCGVYGFKPPFGRVPTSDIAYETLGPLTRTFDDLVLMQNVLCGPSPKVHASLRPKLEYPAEYSSVKGQKIAVCYFKDWYEGGCDKEVIAAMDKAVKELKDAGAQVDVIDIDWKAKESMPTFIKALMSTEMYELVEVTEGADKSKLCSYTNKIFGKVADVGPKKLIAATEMMKRWHKDIQTKVFTKGYIALVMPTLATPYFPADYEASPDKMAKINGQDAKGNGVTLLTPVWNLLNRYPVVDVPMTIAAKNVPVGLQVVGNTFDDLQALRVASALSKQNKQLYKDGMYPDFRNEK